MFSLCLPFLVCFLSLFCFLVCFHFKVLLFDCSYFFFFFFFCHAAILAVSWLPGQELVTVSRAEVQSPGSGRAENCPPTPTPPPHPGNICPWYQDGIILTWLHPNACGLQCWRLMPTNQEYRSTVTLPQPSAGCLKSY